MADVVRSEKLRRHAVTVLAVLGVTAAYLAGGRIGLLLQVTIGGAVITPLWPPTGIALACLFYLGLRIWPGIALGTFLVIMTINPTVDIANAGIMAGNTIAPLFSYLMLRRVGFRLELDRLRDGLALVFLGALPGMLISATIGAGVLVLSGTLHQEGFWSAWAAWWVGDAMGILVITPLLLAVRTVRTRPWQSRPYWWPEAVAMLVTAVAMSVVATRSELAILFLVFPVLIWAALRFQLLGTAPCALLLSVMAISAATDGTGPFAGHSLFAVMVNLQLLNGSAALTGLLLAAIVTEQNAIRHKIEQACLELAEVVDHLAPGSAAHLWPPWDEERRRDTGQDPGQGG